MKQWFINNSLQRPKLTLLIMVLLTLIIGSGVRTINIDDNIMNLLPKDIPSRVVWEEINEKFGETEFMFVAFGNPNEKVYNSKTLETAWELTEQFENITLDGKPLVEEVISIATLNKINSEDGWMEVNNLMPEKQLSESEIAEIKLYLEENTGVSSRILGRHGNFMNVVIRPMDNLHYPQLTQEVSKITKPYENDFEFHLGGESYIVGKIPEIIVNEVGTLMGVGLILMIIVLLANLRNWTAVAMVLSVIMMSALAMMGFMGWVVHFSGSSRFDFSMLNTSMPIVLLTIANSDGVHVISRFFREARKHKNVEIAIRKTMNQLMLPIFLTSLTTVAAFLTLLSSPIRPMIGYGVTIGFGIIWAWLLSTIFLPSLISLKKWNLNSTALSKPSIIENIIHRFSKDIIQRPKKILFGGIAIVLFSLIGFQFIEVEVNVINFFKPGNVLRESTIFLDKEMSGSMSLVMKLEGDMKDPENLNDMVRIQNFLESMPTVNTTISLADVIKEMHKSVMDDDPKFETIPNERDKVNNLFTMYSMSGDDDDFSALVDYEYETGLITAMMQSISTREVVEHADTINNFIKNNTESDMTVHVSGMLMFLNDFVDLVVESSLTSIFFSILIIGAIAWIFFKSWKYGLLSIIPLSSAVILNFGLMGWFGVYLSHFTALLSSIIIGVGVDFSIHYIAEFIHYSKNGVAIDKISQKSMDDVGYPILLDAFSNMGFGALIFSTLIPLVHMGGLMVFAMISTSLGTLTILASSLELFKHKLVKH